MQKRGATNIEFVLAFVLFAGFIATILYLFNPIRTTGIPETTRSYIVNEIVSNVSVKLDSYSVTIPAAVSDEVIAVNISGEDGGMKSRVENYYGSQFKSERVGDIVYFNRTSRTEGFASVKLSEDFKVGAGVSNKPNLYPIHYKIASSSSDEVISEIRVRKLNESYYGDYNDLKKQLGIPDNIDFSFVLTMADGFKITAEKGIPLRAEVFSENVLKEILREDGVSEFGDLTVKIW
jgi:hypothetical protein